VPKTRQAQARLQLTQIPYAATQQDAERLKAKYQGWCRTQGLEAAAQVLDRDWDRMLTFYQFPKDHWVHLRMSNPIESPVAALRLRTDAGRSGSSGWRTPRRSSGRCCWSPSSGSAV
jgi:transposase-like protein